MSEQDEPRENNLPGGEEVRGVEIGGEFVPFPSPDEFVIEDDTPVDNIYAEKQQRLLTETLYSSWSGPPDGKSFIALANVGLFFIHKGPPLVPDVMVATDVDLGEDLRKRVNLTYFVWERGKAPDLVIEIVSDRRGGEDTTKFEQYARAGVCYYVILDPWDCLKAGRLRSFANHVGVFQPLEEHRFPTLGLGLTLWEGVYEGGVQQWLRWCDAAGKLLPTGRERGDSGAQAASEALTQLEAERHRAAAAEEQAERERLQAERERQQRERLEAKLRALGIDPES